MITNININKLKTLLKLISYAPKSFGYYNNLFKALSYNIKPPKYKNPKLKFLPLSATIYVNTICNYRCNFCFLITKEHLGSKKMNMSIEQFQKIINHPNNKYATRITLGGGEPFLNKEFFNFIKELRLRRKLISVYTNGSLIERHFEEFRRNPTDYLNISHYDDKFSSVLKGLEKIKSMANKPVTRLSKIISTGNIEDMKKILLLATDLRFDSVIFQNYFPSVSFDPSEYNKVIFTDNEKFKEEKKELKYKFPNLEIIWPNILKRNAPFNCQNIAINSTYDANGHLAPCCFIVPPKENFGNLFKDKDPWNSKAMISFRESFKNNLKEHKSCTNCYFRQGLGGRYR